MIRNFLFCLISLFLLNVNNSVQAKAYNIDETQSVYIVDNGMEAFFHRIKLIRSAEKTINIEYFIFNSKTKSTQILLRELVLKAKGGVKVRILLDNFYYNLTSNLSNILLKEGIEIKRYNSSFFISKKGQHRNHRKLLTVDGEKAIIGGRNISDEYFDISKKFNFHDRDQLIEGSLVKVLDASFYEFWNFEYSKPVLFKIAPKVPKSRNLNRQVKRRHRKRLSDEKRSKKYIYKKIPSLSKLKKELLTKGEVSFSKNKQYQCEKSVFVTDEPGQIGAKNKTSSTYLYNKIQNIESSLLIETPYFLPQNREYKLFSDLLINHKEISLITNGINGTDSALISALFLDNVDFFVEKGMSAYIHPGRNLHDQDDKGLWALHNKTFLFDRKDIIIGSYNLDPRSRSLNAEMYYECSNNSEMAKDVEDIFNYNKSQSIAIDIDGNPVSAEDESFRYKMKYITSNLMTHFLKHFDFLL